jgi:energy-coupling factor transporter ATP-binding protein EcfA2
VEEGLGRYAILDECTSAVSSEMERRMYAICLEYDITYITISHKIAVGVEVVVRVAPFKAEHRG